MLRLDNWAAVSLLMRTIVCTLMLSCFLYVYLNIPLRSMGRELCRKMKRCCKKKKKGRNTNSSASASPPWFFHRPRKSTSGNLQNKELFGDAERLMNQCPHPSSYSCSECEELSDSATDDYASEEVYYNPSFLSRICQQKLQSKGPRVLKRKI
ncbi:unnamed protein product [Calicophoron daubneyi]|uniref:Uncharacterized protein n=1 Tax=Calicophoron daubneyi TaxID=300641 RepID=A0AAV2TT20_CALDB